MTCAEVSRLKRSYDRNLGWCRFWLGISLAVATLTFTFAMDRVFDPLFDSSTEGPAPAVNGPSNTDHVDQANLVGLIGIAVICILVFVGGIRLFLSIYFRVLYRRDDTALAAMRASQ